MLVLQESLDSLLSDNDELSDNDVVDADADGWEDRKSGIDFEVEKFEHTGFSELCQFRDFNGLLLPFPEDKVKIVDVNAEEEPEPLGWIVDEDDSNNV